MPQDQENERSRLEKLSDFLIRKYHAWAAQNTHGANYPSQSDFAKHIKVKQSTWSSWINQTRLPTAELADLLADAPEVGPQVYDICGISRRMPRDPMLMTIADNWRDMSVQQRRQLTETARNFRDAATQKKGDVTAAPVEG